MNDESSPSRPPQGDLALSSPGGSSPADGPPRLRWRLAALLFLATVTSILYAGAARAQLEPSAPIRLADGLSFALPLIAILVVHEFSHFGFARLHGVGASLPFFIPMPNLFGTMGAIIVMRDRIRSRNALLDIGASGPLGGLLIALPVLAYGLSVSPVLPIPGHGMLEGQCLLYWALKRLVLGPIPPGYDVELGPTALAGWTGLLVTMLNLIPTGQLDGGHVAYALLGEKQTRYARLVRGGLLLFAVLVGATYGYAAVHAGESVGASAAKGFAAGAPWLGWFVILSLLRRFSRVEHPPTDPGELSPGRRVVAVVTLVAFALLFMPTLLTEY